MDPAAIITAVALLITAVVSAVNLGVSLRNGRKLKKVEIQTDGLTTALLKETREGALAEGKKQQTDETAKAEGVAAIAENKILKDQKPGI